MALTHDNIVAGTEILADAVVSDSSAPGSWLLLSMENDSSRRDKIPGRATVCGI